MILTKDNILRFVRDKKAVTPTMVSEAFDTTTMIASAALSETAKDKLILITHLKLASSPYYYDPKQKSYLIDIGEKHLSKGEKDIFLKLKGVEIMSDNSLTIQEKLAIEKIKDFAIPLKVNVEEQEMLFWVWYMRSIPETKKQILDALKPDVSVNQSIKKVDKKRVVLKQKTKQPIKQVIQSQVRNSRSVSREVPQYENQRTMNDYSNNYNNIGQSSSMQQYNQAEYSRNNISNQNLKQFTPQMNHEENQVEDFIENYFNENYLKVENKQKKDKGILYQTSLVLNRITIEIDCFYFYKKTNEADLFKFYTSSLKPKIIFIVNSPKKLLKLSENIENLTIVNI